MNADLRSALHDLAEGQSFAPDPATWDRGRRARRRSRVVAGAAALGVVAVVAGVGALATGAPKGLAPADQDVVPAIPSRIEQVPSGLDKETDLAIGRGSAAFVNASGDPVVIGATDGKPHVLDLLDWDRETPAIALSPDGLHLAWQPLFSGDPVPKVALLDLVTGDVAQAQLGGGSETDFRTLSWSPGSGRVAVLGRSVNELGTGQDWFGQVDVATATGVLHAPLGGNDDPVGIAVANDGTLAVGTEEGDVVIDDGGRRRRVPSPEGIPGRFSPDGTELALSRRSPVSSSITLVPSTGEQLRHPFPADTLGPSYVGPLGWLDDRLQLLAATPEDEGSDPELVVTTPEVGETSTWRRRVGSVDPDVADTLSLAVDLIPDLDGTSSQELTHDFGEPSQRDISWMIGLGVAAAIAVLLGLRWLWRRFVGN